MNPLNVIGILAAFTIVTFIATPADAAENETGQYCEANPTACAVDRTASNHPMYDHGGQPPKDAK